jgi:hypothetical protein
MMMMSSSVRRTSMFIPNSPSPPSGMAHTEDWLNLFFFRPGFRSGPAFENFMDGAQLRDTRARHAVPLLQK